MYKHYTTIFHSTKDENGRVVNKKFDIYNMGLRDVRNVEAVVIVLAENFQKVIAKAHQTNRDFELQCLVSNIGNRTKQRINRLAKKNGSSLVCIVHYRDGSFQFQWRHPLSYNNRNWGSLNEWKRVNLLRIVKATVKSKRNPPSYW